MGDNSRDLFFYKFVFNSLGKIKNFILNIQTNKDFVP